MKPVFSFGRTEKTGSRLSGVATAQSNSVHGLSALMIAISILASVNAKAGELPVIATTASADDGNVPANAVDGSLTTRWSASGDGQWIRFDLGTTAAIGSVK